MSDFASNLKDTEQYIKRFKDQPLGHLIAGKSTASLSGKTFANESPIDNSPLGQVAAGDEADVDLACKAAPVGARCCMPLPMALRHELTKSLW